MVFTTAAAMFNALRAGRGDGSFERRFHALIQPEVLVIDDLGERPPRFDEPDDLCQLVRGRYERGATIITSNLAIPEWAPLFGGAVAASAALDRLLHNAVVLKLDGESHRTSPRARKKG